MDLSWANSIAAKNVQKAFIISFASCDNAIVDLEINFQTSVIFCLLLPFHM